MEKLHKSVEKDAEKCAFNKSKKINWLKSKKLQPQLTAVIFYLGICLN